MDTDSLLAHARARFDHETQKRLLREKYESKMLFAHSGGMWRAGPELQTTLMCCPDDSSVILDLYGNPIRVICSELMAASQQRWQEQMNLWLDEYDSSRRQR